MNGKQQAERLIRYSEQLPTVLSIPNFKNHLREAAATIAALEAELAKAEAAKQIALGALRGLIDAGLVCETVWKETHSRVAPHIAIESVTGEESLRFFEALEKARQALARTRNDE
jgi:hypothetical protein